MIKDQYLETVKEQVQAYGYEPTQLPPECPVEALFINEDKGGGRSWKAIVAVMELDEASVGHVREASNTAREVIRKEVGVKRRTWKDRGDRALVYLLLIPPSISEQMEIYVEEGHKTLGGDPINQADTWLYPILADLENDRLVYRESAGIKKIFLQYALGNEVQRLFQISSENAVESDDVAF